MNRNDKDPLTTHKSNSSPTRQHCQQSNQQPQQAPPCYFCSQQPQQPRVHAERPSTTPRLIHSTFWLERLNSYPPSSAELNSYQSTLADNQQLQQYQQHQFGCPRRLQQRLRLLHLGMNRPVSVNKWNTHSVASARKSVHEQHDPAEVDQKKYDPCVSFIAGAPKSSQSRSGSNSNSGSFPTTPSQHTGSNSPGRKLTAIEQQQYSKDSSKDDSPTQRYKDDSPTQRHSSVQRPIDSTVSFLAGKPLIATSDVSLAGGEQGAGAVSPAALNNALRKQVYKSNYGKRLAPKMIEGVSKPGAVSKIAGVFAEKDAFENLEAQQALASRKSSAASILRDDFRSTPPMSSMSPSSLSRSDISGPLTDDTTTNRQPNNLIVEETARKERRPSTGLNTRGIRNTRPSLSSQTSQATLIESRPYAMQAQAVGSDSNTTSSGQPVDGKSVHVLLSPKSRQRKFLGRLGNSGSSSSNRKQSGSSLEDEVTSPFSDSGADGSEEEILYDTKNQGKGRRTSYLMNRHKKKISIPDTIEADDEDSDINSPQLHRKSSQESLDEDDQRLLPITKEGDFSMKLEKSIERKRASARTWKPLHVVLRGHNLYCYKERGVNSDDDLSVPISLVGSTVDIASNYQKRKNVFRVSTQQGNEFLFQAQDMATATSWVITLQRANPEEQPNGRPLSPSSDNNMSPPQTSKSGGNRRTLSIKKSHFSLNRSGSKKRPNNPPPVKKSSSPVTGKTFGVCLQDCPAALNTPNVPFIVEFCCNQIEEKGRECVGIYRVSGNVAATIGLQNDFDTMEPSQIDFSAEKWQELYNLGSLLKGFLRKLPDPVIPSTMYAQVIESSRTADLHGRLVAIRNTMNDLPEYHYDTLAFLTKHLKAISDNCERNKMEPKNIAIIFGPTIVRPSEENMITMVKDMSDQLKVIETLVHQYDWIFGDAETYNSDVCDQTEIIGASKGLVDLVNAAQEGQDMSLVRKDKAGGNSMYKNLKANITMKMKDKAGKSGVSPIFNKRFKSNELSSAQAISEDESDEDTLTSGNGGRMFARSRSTPPEQRVSNKTLQRQQSKDESDIHSGRSRNMFGRSGTSASGQSKAPPPSALSASTIREIVVSPMDGMSTKMGTVPAGSAVHMKFISKDLQGTTDYSSGGASGSQFAQQQSVSTSLLSEKTRSRLQQVSLAHQQQNQDQPLFPHSQRLDGLELTKDDDADSGLAVSPQLSRRGDNDNEPLSSPTCSTPSSRKESFDSLSGPSPLIQRRAGPTTMQTSSNMGHISLKKQSSFNSSGDDKSPTQSKQFGNVSIPPAVITRQDNVGRRRRNNEVISPAIRKRELHSIYPGEGNNMDEQLRMMLEQDKTAGQTVRQQPPSRQPSTDRKPSRTNNGDSDKLIRPSDILNNGSNSLQPELPHPVGGNRPTSNSDWWNPHSGGNAASGAGVGQQRSAAVNIIKNAISSIKDQEQQSDLTPASYQPEYLNHPQILGPTKVKLPTGSYFTQQTYSNPNLSARLDSHNMKKSELDRKVSSILSDSGSERSSYSDPACSSEISRRLVDSSSRSAGSDFSTSGVGSSSSSAETKQEKLERYIKQVKELLKDSPNKPTLHRDDKHRLSIILQSLQKAASDMPPPSMPGGTNSNTTFFFGNATTPASKFTSNLAPVTSQSRIPFPTTTGLTASTDSSSEIEGKYSKLYPR